MIKSAAKASARRPSTSMRPPPGTLSSAWACD